MPLAAHHFISNGTPTTEFHITEQCSEQYHDTKNANKCQRHLPLDEFDIRTLSNALLASKKAQ